MTMIADVSCSSLSCGFHVVDHRWRRANHVNVKICAFCDSYIVKEWPSSYLFQSSRQFDFECISFYGT